MKSASALIDERIDALGDWRGKTFARVRKIIHAADPDIVEEWKWMGTPIFSHGGKDPRRLFNSSLEGNVRRAIDIREGDKIDEKALQALVRAAVALNTSKRAAARPVRSAKKAKSA